MLEDGTSIGSLVLGSSEQSTGRNLSRWSLVVAVSNESVLQHTLLSSPVIDAGCQVILKRGFPSAAKAYNSGIAEARNEIIVFAHQDIFLPGSWKFQMEHALSELAAQDPNWGVLGLVGVKQDSSREIVGYCYSTGLRQIVGQPFAEPVEALSLDEILLVIRRSSGLTFDEALPGFHLYGTDICQLAKQKKLKSYVVQSFCIHNTNGIKSFPLDFWRGYLYLRRKWRLDLPIRTCCTRITRGCGPAIRRIVKDFARAIFWPRDVGSRWDDVGRLRQFVERERSKFEAVSVSAGSQSGEAAQLCPVPQHGSNLDEH